MKVLRLKGGIGNQLFILGKALELQRSEKVFIYARPTHRKDRMPETQLVRFLSLQYSSTGLLSLALRSVEKLELLQRSKVYLDGYFQSPEDFSNIPADAFGKFSAYFGLFPFTQRPRVVLHIRLGDFLYAAPDQILAPEYYLEELDQIADPSLDVRVVSDADHETLINRGYGAILGRENVKLVKNKHRFFDFKYISESSHVIGSNSTYCFWATALGNRHHRKAYISVGPVLKPLEAALSA